MFGLRVGEPFLGRFRLLFMLCLEDKKLLGCFVVVFTRVVNCPLRTPIFVLHLVLSRKASCRFSKMYIRVPGT